MPGKMLTIVRRLMIIRIKQSFQDRDGLMRMHVVVGDVTTAGSTH